MHVAAPILDGGRIRGVLTVAMPTSSVMPFALRSRHRVLLAGLALMGSALVIGAALSWWLTRSVDRLRTYAREVSEGRKAALPELGRSELAELGRALESMREKLEGRQYVERYVHTLTHEMKSPLAGIRGAVELLEEDMPEADRARFLTHIREQEFRLRRLVERMLDLATLQHRQVLSHPELLPLGPLVARVLEGKEATRTRRGVLIQADMPPGAQVWGEAFLLEQALSNLVDNALEFSPRDGLVSVTWAMEGDSQILAVRDRGPGIPAYALDRVLEPFYSLPRPDSQGKSTGLGLSFAKEIAALHRGRVEVANHPEGGVEARLILDFTPTSPGFILPS
jgi:two-component system sensor histidine kinase CreC